MKLRAIALYIWLCVFMSTASGQAGDDQAVLRLRISSVPSQGTVVVDRGATDGVELGDTVVFMPRSGRMPRGRVTRVDERSAIVELLNQQVTLAPGTRGALALPADRRGPPPPVPAEGAPKADEPRQEPVKQAGTAEPVSDDGEEHDWEREDEWEPGMPLLAKVSSVHPKDRETKISGRVYTIGEQIWTSESDRSTTTLRTGGALVVENPFGSGGSIKADGELNYQDANVPDADGDTSSRLRVDRLSYSKGGTRYDNRRWEGGRFLQYGMPEFGVLDGFEYGIRGADGHRFGGGIGFMPEPDNEMSTGDDMQVSGYYQWVADSSERVAATAGYQKTWHNGNADRDLVIGKFHYLPVRGWNYDTTVWVDMYTDGDDQKPLLQVTQAYARAGYESRRGHGLDVSYTHLAFPQIDRNEFLPVLDDQLADDHRERIAVDSWVQSTRATRTLAGLGIWADQEGSGIDAEVGVDIDDVFVRRSQLGLTLFGTDGAFTSTMGGRARFGKELENGRWDVLYEYANNDQRGFGGNNDDFLQSWLRATRDFYTPSGWNVSLSADYRDWQDETSWSLGFYVQKSF